MCCRYALLQDHTKTFLARLGVRLEGGGPPASRYNISPGTPIASVRHLPGAATRELAPLHWGLVPSWAREPGSPAVNARAESLAGKPSFRDAFRSRRCLVPASGFYEWKAAGRARQPWLFRLRDGQPFALAGLWDAWRAPDGAVIESCAIVTTAPNAVMEPVHHRMPVMLTDPAAWALWLDPRITEPSSLASCLRPCPDATMTALAVSTHVNDTRHDDPGCFTPAPADDQLGLGFDF